MSTPAQTVFVPSPGIDGDGLLPDLKTTCDIGSTNSPRSSGDSDEADGATGEIGDGEETDQVTSLSAISSARKQVHLAMFDDLQRQLARSGTGRVLKTEAKEELSLKAIMATQQSNPIISSPRDYQLELFQRAKDQNTIAVLDTGSGKTLIAVLLLQHVIDQELEDRAAQKPHRVSFFLVEKVALAHQQHAVLKANLDQNVDLIFGAMQPDLWTNQIWTDHRLDNMVIVCTAEILLQALLRSFVQVHHINLLIFDEAHHAKKDHPYARIIKDCFAREPDRSKRPRIFGMTASPVDGDAGHDLEEKARELEMLLDATIATASDLRAFQRDFAIRPKEHITRYMYLPRPSQTDLFCKLEQKFSDFVLFQSFFQRAQELNAELGPWCSSKFWSLVLSSGQIAKMEDKMDRQRQNIQAKNQTERNIDDEIARLKDAFELVQNHSLDLPNLSTTDLSPKVVALFELLLLEYERPTESKCLVFVQRRDTAKLLCALARHLGGRNLKPGILTGTNSSSDVSSVNFSARQQALTMMKFRNQDLNCLFATSVAEEGIDVPDCNLVIRFDPCSTVIQYIQSRGRARHKNSKVGHCRRTILQEMSLSRIWAGERALQELCKALPQDRKIDADHVSTELDVSRASRFYIVPSTGAKLTYDFSLQVLANFVSHIPHDEEEDMAINYYMTCKAGNFVCEVILPPNSPVHSATGRSYPRKALAKRSAAFEACIMLISRNYLDDNLLPTYAKKLPAMRNAHLALSAHKSNQYFMQTKPHMWQDGRGTLPATVFLTLITLEEQWDRPIRPMGLLTRQKLPELPAFPIFRIGGQSSNVLTLTSNSELEISEIRLGQLTWFCLTMFKDVFNKTFENNPAQMSYWLAPLLISATSPLKQLTPCSDMIDWDFVSELFETEPYSWSREMAHESLINKFLVDPWHGGRRFFTKRVAHEYRPQDPVPNDCASDKKQQSIIEYSVKLYKKSRLGRVWDDGQPVIEAERAMHRLNVLADPSKEEQEALSKCFLCLEPLKFSQLPSDIAAICMLFPAIIHRIESYLIAFEFANTVGLDIPPQLALEAVTKDSDNMGDVMAERIKFQRGMGPNYERLEFLGDCFLKMATSISVFTLYSNNDEFEMHVDRMCMLCNKNLFNNAKQNEWYKYIRSTSFSRRHWYPHDLKLLEGLGAKTQEQQATVYQDHADKTIADVCEAMIGAALLAHFTSGYDDTSQFDNAVKAVSQFVASKDHPMQKWADYFQAYTPPKYQTEDSSASQRDLAQQLKTKHPYAFKYPRLARSAFMHPSQPKIVENVPSYQRLEFLGDSLLDLAAVSYLYEKFPSKDPQWLTEHKMAIVSNRFLSALCVKLGFHKHLRHSHASVEAQIRHFVEEAEETERNANGAREYWMTLKEPPKCLSDIVEAYIGAVFVDSEYNYAEVQRFFDMHIRWFFEDMSMYDSFANNHPVTKLHALLSETMGCSFYRLIAREMSYADGGKRAVLAGVFVHAKTVASYQGTSVRYAKVKAAALALDELKGKAPYEFRAEFGCDCKSVEEAMEKLALEDVVGPAV